MFSLLIIIKVQKKEVPKSKYLLADEKSKQ
jgi:hypothetical protein